MRIATLEFYYRQGSDFAEFVYLAKDDVLKALNLWARSLSGSAAMARRLADQLVALPTGAMRLAYDHDTVALLGTECDLLEKVALQLRIMRCNEVLTKVPEIDGAKGIAPNGQGQNGLCSESGETLKKL